MAKEPTERQRKAFKALVENGRNKGEALVKAGYSKETAKAPTKVTESKGFKKLMKDYFEDDLLAKVHNEGLKASRKIIKDNEVIEEPDYAVRHKYLDTAYKLKGEYSPSKLDITTKGESLNDLKELSNEELQQIAKGSDGGTS